MCRILIQVLLATAVLVRPVSAQASLTRAQDSAATDRILRTARDLERLDSLWRIADNVVVMIRGAETAAPDDQSRVVASHFGAGAHTARRIDTLTACPVVDAIQVRDQCDSSAGVQVLSISSPRCDKSRCRYLLTLSRQGRLEPQGTGRSSEERNGRIWRVVLEPDGEGGYVVVGRPSLIIP